jgi:hypothetical protein
MSPKMHERSFTSFLKLARVGVLQAKNSSRIPGLNAAIFLQINTIILILSIDINLVKTNKIKKM